MNEDNDGNLKKRKLPKTMGEKLQAAEDEEEYEDQ